MSATPSDALVLYGQSFDSRLLLGTSRYPSPAVLLQAIERSKPAMLDVVMQWVSQHTTELAQSFDMRFDHD